MGEVGKVLDVLDDKVKVSMTRTEACAKCGACSKGLKSEEMIIYAINECDASKDDWVKIDLEGAKFLKAVFIMYAIPFAFFILGISLGYYFDSYINFLNIETEIFSFILGILFTILAFFIIRMNEDKLKKQRFTVSAIEKVTKPLKE